MKYMRKTPVEAIQWRPDNRTEFDKFVRKYSKDYAYYEYTSGNILLSYWDFNAHKHAVKIPKFGWVVREGKTFQFYKDATFRKTFEEVPDDEHKGIDWEGMDKTIREAFDGFDEVIKGFKDVFGAAPIKVASDDAIRTSIQFNPDGRLTKLIDDLYKDDEKTREEIKKNLSEGLKEMAGSDTHKATFESVLDEMKELHAKKDKDYNESFHNLFKEYGMPYALAHIEEKLNRVKAIIANGGNAVKNEHIEDSLIDGACYNILTLIELRNGKH